MTTQHTPAARRILGAATAVLFASWGVWAILERRWSGPLYCIERPGTLWNGLAQLPENATPECPDSRSYRHEVRRGETRVEQYRLPGWHPQALLAPLKQAGYRQQTNDPISENTYAAFLQRSGVTLQYLAVREDNTTLITLSGRP